MKNRILASILLSQLCLATDALAEKRKVATPLKERTLLVPQKGSLAKPKSSSIAMKRDAQIYRTVVPRRSNWAEEYGTIDVEGYAPGDELHLERQHPSQAIQAKPGEAGLRTALRAALKFVSHPGILISTQGRTQTWASRFTLPEFSTTSSRQTFEVGWQLRPGDSVLALSREHTYRISMMRDDKVIGTHLRREHTNDYAGYGRDAWVQRDNLFVSPVYANNDGEGEAVLLGLASFPLGAPVSITDMTKLRSGLIDHSVSSQASTTTGSARLVIANAVPGHEYKVVVAGQTATAVTFRLPAHDHPLVAKSGMGYYDLKHFEVEQ